MNEPWRPWDTDPNCKCILGCVLLKEMPVVGKRCISSVRHADYSCYYKKKDEPQAEEG